MQYISLRYNIMYRTIFSIFDYTPVLISHTEEKYFVCVVFFKQIVEL